MGRKKCYAAIDVGSHEVQMQIAELSREDRPRVLETYRRTLPIGIDTYTGGSISQETINALAEVLQGFVREMKGYRIGGCRTVATSAFREAANQAFACEQIRMACGLSIDVLSNAQERAGHILAAATRLKDFADMIRQGTLLVDIGSGSVQVTVYDRSEFIFSQNMLLGSLRIRELLSDLERRAADFAGLMDEYISSDLDNYHLLEPKGILYKHLVILGGELPYLKRMAGQDPEADAVLHDQQMNLLYQQLLIQRPFEMAVQRGIPAEHATLLLPMAIMIRKFMQFTGTDSIVLPATSLCDAILLEFARSEYGFEPPHNPDVDMLSACRHIARRYRADHKHASFVEQAALTLYDATIRLHGLADRERLLLQAAVILHDSGKYISMSRHHMQSCSLIQASEIIGLSQREKDIVAWTSGFHIGSFDMKLDGFAGLQPDDQLIVAKLTAILRIANALDSGHRQKISSIEVQLDDREMVLAVTTSQDVILEIWSLDRHGELFHQLFGIRPRIRIRSARS